MRFPLWKYGGLDSASGANRVRANKVARKCQWCKSICQNVYVIPLMSWAKQVSTLHTRMLWLKSATAGATVCIVSDLRITP